MAPNNLTKREYFAAMAMQALLSCGVFEKVEFDVMASYTISYADALIAELEKERDSRTS